jgi:hypothetical protein
MNMSFQVVLLSKRSNSMRMYIATSLSEFKT